MLRDSPSDLFTTAEVAAMVGLKQDSITRARYRGKIKGTLVGGRVFYTRTEVERFRDDPERKVGKRAKKSEPSDQKTVCDIDELQ